AAGQARFARGQVTIGVQAKRAEAGEAAVTINAAVLARYLTLANELAEDGATPPSADGLLALRGVIEAPEEADDPEARAAVEAAMTRTVEEALDALKASPEGRIVNVGSAAALKAGAGMGAYGAAKAGVHALTQALAEELKTTKVTVNAVLPSIIDTPANRKDMPDADPATWVAPADLAAVILFLASPESRAMTGALVPVTGRV
uniref:SDR family oxidoreductase n=1 Tax=Sphingobium sp. TaxID=1912891 RepID=UPI0035C6E4B0